ncbi:RNA polymerase sigma-70 factor, ECF subfamily [Paraburkholderia fungorum]|uniref:RNA polymerase sigma-70 factor, ECF subfamily n=1 Tax=Paraburkholderia fungorum TaxID=134537 RepID=A0A1H1JKA9_9BURK|nr:sigma-70 family RNA polymerase sigma factor [Paraburkholderia fungorum]SDR50350.1 RNA polymerase sigma-70 factor, ECF subfamily [Paraburkholderia fungorum]
MSSVPLDAQQGVRALYRDHHGWLQSWLHRKLGNAFDAADLAHDTFLRILCARDRQNALDPDLDLREPRAYLTTVAGRLVLNHYRRLSLERAYLDALSTLPESLVPSPEDQAVILETLHEIDAMLDRLSAKARTTFLLAQLEGLTYAEIAERLQVNIRTVKRYMAAAYEECILLTT